MGLMFIHKRLQFDSMHLTLTTASLLLFLDILICILCGNNLICNKNLKLRCVSGFLYWFLLEKMGLILNQFS